MKIQCINREVNKGEMLRLIVANLWGKKKCVTSFKTTTTKTPPVKKKKKQAVDEVEKKKTYSHP